MLQNNCNGNYLTHVDVHDDDDGANFKKIMYKNISKREEINFQINY